MFFSRVSLSCWAVAACLGSPGHLSAQPVPPYQPIAERQICGASPVRDQPGGQAVAELPAATHIAIRDLGFDDAGALYYRIDQPVPGYVASTDAPNFCGFAERTQPGPAYLRALPNNCHLIAASRQSIDEVNAFAAEHAEFMPTMQVYRADNGWYAISLGQVSLAAAPAVLDRARNIPPDAYCSDGARYVAMLDQQYGRFHDPAEAPMQDPRRLACLQGQADACHDHAQASAPETDRSDDDHVKLARFHLLACMAGHAQDCLQAAAVPNRFLDHVLRLAAPTPDEGTPSLTVELYRIGCDAGLSAACASLAGAELTRVSGDPGTYLTAVQGLVYACTAQDHYACRDLLRLLAQRQKVLDGPASADTQYHSARLWAGFCRQFPDAADDSCRPVHEAYADLLALPGQPAARMAEMRAFLRTGCASGFPDACVRYSQLPGDKADREWAAARASANCTMASGRDPVCSQLDARLGADLTRTGDLKSAEFKQYADACTSANTDAGAEACSAAMSYYLRHISNADLDPLEEMLNLACKPGHIAGCGELAFFYSPFTRTGENLRFTGRDQPQKRLAALKTGCQPGPLGLWNCAKLGDLLVEGGDYDAAQAAFDMACATDGARGKTNACFNIGYNALTRLNDDDTARASFANVCDSPSDMNMPYACKHLALIEMRDGTGGDRLGRILGLLQRACYPPDAARGDGEGCLYYGRTILEQRDRLEWHPDDGAPVATLSASAPDRATLLRTAHEASNIYAQGCRSRWQAACAANEALIDDWAAGAFPQHQAICQIRNAAGQITSEKGCNLIPYAEPLVIEYEDGAILDASLYIWPDGDRTLVTEQWPTVWLNGRETSSQLSVDGTAQCQQNPETGNSFCVLNAPEDG